MELEISDVNSIEQITQMEQLLTADGARARSAPYISGRAVSERGVSFFGKKAVVAEMEEQLNTTGIAVVEGGRRSGKTSLLQIVGEQMTRAGTVQTSVIYNLQANYANSPEEVANDIQEEINYSALQEKKGAAVPVNAVISFDEIEAYESSNQDGLLDTIEQLRTAGHKVVISVTGDLHGNSPSELARPVKDRILKMVGSGVIINKLLDDEEMGQLLAHGDKPIFSEIMTKFLITESGGHPFLAQILASEAFRLIKSNKVKPDEFLSELRRKMREHLSRFGAVVDRITAAGFNPLTWEWNGKGDQPNVEVYQNMIPKFTSKIFREWLSGYLAK